MFKYIRSVAIATCPSTQNQIPQKIRNYSNQSKVFNKLMNRGGKKRSWHNFEFQQFNPGLPSPESLSKGPQSTKRVAVLNKMFMKHITDLMATGDCANQIVGQGIEVTRVKVGSEYNVVNVYWTCHKEHNEEATSQLLSRTASMLRHELSNLRVMGKVPVIQFVRDRSVHSWAAVEAVLKTADMGDDYVPKGEDLLKSEFGNEKADANSDITDAGTSDLPVMRQNVFGVDRNAILNRILSKMKSRPALKSIEEPNDGYLHQQPFAPFNEEAFSQFLLKRKIMKEKANKVEREEIELADSEPDNFSEEFGAYDGGDYLDEEIDDYRDR